MKACVWRAGPAARLGLLLAALASPGCVTLGGLCCTDKPPKGHVCQLHASWQSTVAQTYDSVNGGAPLRGIAGRVYLLPEKEITTLDGDGEIVVDLYDERPTAVGAPPKHLEQWRFPPEVLSQLQRKDAVGWGYTLFLPWSTMQPDINRVQLRVCYAGRNGTTLYTSASMALHHGDRPMHLAAQHPQHQGNPQAPAQAHPQPRPPMPQQTQPAGIQQAGAAVPAMPTPPPAPPQALRHHATQQAQQTESQLKHIAARPMTETSPVVTMAPAAPPAPQSPPAVAIQPPAATPPLAPTPPPGVPRGVAKGG